MCTCAQHLPASLLTRVSMPARRLRDGVLCPRPRRPGAEGLCVAMPIYYATGSRWKVCGTAAFGGLWRRAAAALARLPASGRHPSAPRSSSLPGRAPPAGIHVGQPDGDGGAPGGRARLPAGARRGERQWRGGEVDEEREGAKRWPAPSPQAAVGVGRSRRALRVDHTPRTACLHLTRACLPPPSGAEPAGFRDRVWAGERHDDLRQCARTSALCVPPGPPQLLRVSQ